MKLQMDLEWLKKQTLYVATPTHNDICATPHHMATIHFSNLLYQYGISHHVSCIADSLVTRARNRMVWKFLTGNYTHMLFIDSDIHYFGGDAVHLLVLSQQFDGVLAVPYPKKELDWERVAEAAKRGVPAKELAAVASSHFVLNWATPPERLRLDQPTLMRDMGTGYMLIPRSVFQTMIDKQAVQRCKLTHEEEVKYKTDYMWAFFLDPIDPETELHLSEDWFFCRQWIKTGGKVWMCPWMRTRHCGPYEYIGDIPAVANAGGEL